MITVRRAGLAALAMVAVTSITPMTASADGTTQVGGTAFPGPGECDEEADGVAAPDYIAVMTGDLEGCLYQYVDWDSVRFRPSGTWFERGTEVFVSSTNSADRFFTEYVFTAKYTDDGQHFGRCQHPIVGGEGLYEGATGRLDFKDTIVDGVAVCFEYRGHIKAG